MASQLTCYKVADARSYFSSLRFMSLGEPGWFTAVLCLYKE
jgi:hypothetical protein